MYNFGKQNNNLYSNPYLPKASSVLNNTTPNGADDINALYAQLEALKAQKQALSQTQQVAAQANVPIPQNQQKMPQVKTVYTDIAEIWNSLSAEEQKFVEGSQEYQQANIEYQNAFNSFLLDKMGAEFLTSKYSEYPERVLAVIKTKKEEYQNNLTNDISTIKSQNEALIKQNSELAKNNEELGKLIKSLQEQMWVNK